MRRWALLVSLLAFIGCDDDDGTVDAGAHDAVGLSDAAVDARAEPDAEPETDAALEVDAAVEADAAPVDDQPPALRDVRVRFGGTMLDLNGGDAEWTLPVASEGVFTVLARDDQASADDLIVRVTELDAVEPPEQSAELRNGLWEIRLQLQPERTYRVQVIDPTGNATTSEHALRLARFAEVIPGTWATRFFAPDQMAVNRWETVFTDAGTWQRSRDEFVEAGTWALEDGLLVMEWRTSTDPEAFDDDAETIERRVVSNFFLDGTLFATTPLQRVGEGEGPGGAWTREAREDGERWTVTLQLGDDDRFTEVWRGDREQSWSGTWAWVLSENYIESSGDFLQRTIEQIDGEAVDPPQPRFQLSQQRGDWLLIQPMLRASE